jgi:hypothetical protein
MIQSNDFGTYGVVTDEPINWETFCALCEVVAFLNGQSKKVPSEDILNLIPQAYRPDIEELLNPLTKP